MRQILAILLLIVSQNAVFAERWSCDFSTDLCGIIDSAGPNQGWIRTNDTNIEPGHDYKCSGFWDHKLDDFDTLDGAGEQNLNSRECYWVSTLPPSKFGWAQDFILYSPKLAKTEQNGCLSFKYQFFGFSKASFIIQVNRRQSVFNAEDLWARFVPKKNGWSWTYINIPKQDNDFYLIFRAHLDAKYHQIVGLDDIDYTSYPCSNSSSWYVNAITDFEKGPHPWVLDNAVIATGGRPMNDHTIKTQRGHFVLSTSAQPSVLRADIVELTEYFKYYTDGNCLKFFYYFTANDEDSDTESYIDIHVPGKLITSESQITIQSILGVRLENRWNLHAINIPSHERASGNLTISMYTSKSTEIAIDDILVVKGPCQRVPDCDFESDFCGWSQQLFSTEYWIRSKGDNVGGMKKSPGYDNTAHTGNFWYAMIPVEYFTGNIHATLTSAPLTASAASFEFVYWAQTAKPNQTVLTVTLRDVNKFGRLVPSEKVNGTTDARWAKFSMKLPDMMPKVYTIEISTNYVAKEMLSNIAIDDLKLHYPGDLDSTEASTTPWH